MKKNSLLIIIMVAFALGVGFWREYQRKNSPSASTIISLNGGSLLSPPKSLHEFKLIDLHNNFFTKNHLKNHWSFLYFGYSHCPDICPVTLRTLAELSQQLFNINVQFIFISINPLEDTPHQLKKFLSQTKFHEQVKIVGLGGEFEQIKELGKQMGLHFDMPKNHAEKISHSNAIYLVNPQAKLNAIFTTHKPQIIVQDFKKILKLKKAV